MRTVIKNGRIIDPLDLLDEVGDLYISDSVIAGINKAPADFHPDRTIDASGMLVVPGVVDLSVRMREPGAEHKATIASECRAAVNAGVTSLCCPPDTSPVIDTPAVVELINKHAARAGLARVYCTGALTYNLDGATLANMNALKQAGCIAVSNACAPLVNNAVLRRALEYAATCNVTVHLYCEDASLRGDGVVHDGMISVRLGLPGIPAAAETVAISNTLLLVEQTGAHVHFCRLSCARSIQLIAEARERGLPVSADVAISHLFLSEIDVTGFNTLCHMYPPLRTTSDRDALRSALKNGVIDAICSDHQPHDDDAKSAPFSMTESGASTLDVFLPLALQLVEENVLGLPELIRTLTINPATIAGIDAGGLHNGARADVCIVDTAAEWTVTTESLQSAGKNCPFLGWEMRGRVIHTLVNGETVFARE